MQKHLGVRFVYADIEDVGALQEQSAPLEFDDLPSALSALPTEVFSQLEEAAIICVMGGLEQVISDIRQYNPSLADILTTFVEKFEHMKIISAIQTSQASSLTS
jgi:hypothetical protein